ncbi:30S ribosomal protein S7 [Candidatus Tremblaya phenacola]|uniref:Small ribosomal subunit protein uS7 n=1 Tax=Candidatus Tremblayella phenacoccinincola TaxID=1010676 RepID=A0A2G0V6Y0_9PROT|nr:30S ribosomal protein S7 [Candidatus Tremblaya phenacola]PHN16219.1 30S ribosomal protein S7 [Candidatus Tremblaya phenacola]
MSRKKKTYKAHSCTDYKYRSLEVSKLINVLMKSGEKTKAENIVYSVLSMIHSNQERSLEVFLQALENIKPLVEVKSKRVGGANYRIPVEVKHTRRTTLALRWLKTASTIRSEKTMSLKLYKELMDALTKKGTAIKYRDEMHKLAEVNKAFSHFKF